MKTPFLLTALAWWLAASLGSAAPAHAAPPVPALAQAAAAARASTAITVEATEAARQVMNFAEVSFPNWFPPGAATQFAAPFSFRHYPETGLYLGVVTQAGTAFAANDIYVMGGEFGAAPVRVGRIDDFISPVAGWSLALSVDRLAVQQGASGTVRATLTRQAGFNAAVQLVLDGLPAGVSAPLVTIAAGATTADITLTAQAGAPHSLPKVVDLRAIVPTATGNQVQHLPLRVTVRGPAGSIDTSFGGGIVTLPVGQGEDYGNAVAVQPDGKVLVAGASATNTGTVISLLRFLRDGGLDTTFGTGGRVTTAIGTRSDSAAAIALQADGRIVVAGSSEQAASGLDIAVLRYLPDGRLDPAFGQGGKVVTPVGSDTDRAWAVAIQADGKIVVAGESNTGPVSGVDFALLRYRPDGTLDAGFGVGGKVLTPIKSATGRDAAYALALPLVNGEQRILAVGGDGDFLAARYRPDGSLDTAFGNAGKVNGLFESNIGGARGVVLLPGGQAVLAGAINNDFAAAQLSPTGQLDAGFGMGGRFMHGVAATGNWDGATAVVRQADGKLLLGGWAYAGNGSSGDFAALRLLANGTLDGGFGSGGVVIHPTAAGGKNDLAHGLVLQADDRVPTVRAFQAGEANGSNHDLSLIRLWL